MNPAQLPIHYKSPDRLLRDLGIEDPQDIQIEAIAQYCGATILYDELEGSDARIIGYGQKAFITVSPVSTIARQRFSAAHELGHWMWDRGKMAFECAERQFNSEWTDDNPERRANRYAVDLLLPDGMFRRRMKEQGFGITGVQRLAQDFQTSLTATAIRLVELTEAPAILISSEREKRRWYFRSPQVPRGLKPKAAMEAGSLAHRLLQQDGPPPGPHPVEAGIWIETGDFPLGVVHEDSIHVGQDFYLTLLWWQQGTELRA